MQKKDIENLEIDLLLEGIHRCYGYDFSHYAKASLKRRLKHALTTMELHNFSELLPKLLHDEKKFTEFIIDLSVTVTEMFRDPEFYVAFKKNVVPVLKTYPFIKIWHAGCATGEEVYSMAILLHEADLLKRTQIYGTDFNQLALKVASEGIYSTSNLKQHIENYKKFSNGGSLSKYYHEKYDSIKMNKHLRDHITFAQHNLVVEHHFGEMNVILCRNVLIYFDRTFQNRVLSLFRESLMHRGFLCLGNKESIINSSECSSFDTVSREQKIFRLIDGDKKDEL